MGLTEPVVCDTCIIHSVQATGVDALLNGFLSLQHLFRLCYCEVLHSL